MLTAKTSGNRAIASMRIKWVEELREVLSEYHSILMSVDEFKDEDLRLRQRCSPPPNSRRRRWFSQARCCRSEALWVRWCFAGGSKGTAFSPLRSEKQIGIVPGATHFFEEPGALDEVARLAREWFERHLFQTTRRGAQADR
jgi:hypothetical protein